MNARALLLLVPLLALAGCKREEQKLRKELTRLQAEQQNLAATAANLEQDKQAARADLDKCVKQKQALTRQAKQQQAARAAASAPTAPDLAIKAVELVTDNKTREGALHGPFSVKLTLANTTDRGARQVVLLAALQIYNHTYPRKKPQVTHRLLAVDSLGAGQQQELTFKDFDVGHPGLVHELVINVVPGLAEKPFSGAVKKQRLRVVFSPGSGD